MSKIQEWTLEELLDQLVKYCDEHDLDCEESDGDLDDRCTYCLAREARSKI